MRWTRVLSSIIMLLLVCLFSSNKLFAQEYQIGVYYFPGWTSNSDYWNDLKGLPKSRSPGKTWLEREPSRGFGYPEESVKTAEKSIEWASAYGIGFFAYDWYWDGNKTTLSHAIDNHLIAANKSKLKFCIHWANHTKTPESMNQFTAMVQYWIDHYMKDPQYFTVEGKPMVVIFSPQQLRESSKKFGKTTKELFDISRKMAVKSGLPGLYIVGATYANSYWVNNYLPSNGYDALSAHNYQSNRFSGEYTGKEAYSSSYEDLTEGYKSNWTWILKNSKLPYIVPMSAGWDRRPWGGSKPSSHDNSGSTPALFKQMIIEGKKTIDANPTKTMRMGIIFAWNEFGEGAYIEPTKKWGFQYLQAIKDVFGK